MGNDDEKNMLLKRWRRGISLVLVCSILLSSNGITTFAENADDIWDMFAPEANVLDSGAKKNANASNIEKVDDDTKEDYEDVPEDIENEGYTDEPEAEPEAENENENTNVVDASNKDVGDALNASRSDASTEDVGDALYASRSNADEEAEDSNVDDASNKDVVDALYASRSNADEVAEDSNVDDASNKDVGDALYATRSNADEASPSEIFDDMLTMGANKLEAGSDVTKRIVYYDDGVGGKLWGTLPVTVGVKGNPEQYIRLEQPRTYFYDDYEFVGWLRKDATAVWDRIWWIQKPGEIDIPPNPDSTSPNYHPDSYKLIYEAQWRKRDRSEKGKLTYLDCEGKQIGNVINFTFGDPYTIKGYSSNYNKNGTVYVSYGWANTIDLPSGYGSILSNSTTNNHILAANRALILPKEITLQEVMVARDGSQQRYGDLTYIFKDNKGNELKRINTRWDSSVFLPTEEEINFKEKFDDEFYDLVGWHSDRTVKWRNSATRTSGKTAVWPPGMTFAYESEYKSYLVNSKLPTEVVWTAEIASKLKIRFMDVTGTKQYGEDSPCDRGFNELPAKLDEIFNYGVDIGYPVSAIWTEPNRKGDYCYPGRSKLVYDNLVAVDDVVILYVDTEFIIKFNANNGTWLKTHADVTWDSKSKELSLPPSADLYRIRYNLKGWSLDQAGKKNIGYDKLKYTDVDSEYIYERALTIYAQWGQEPTADNFTFAIQYDTDGGNWRSGREPKGYWTRGTAFPAFPLQNDITKNDQTLIGWYKDKNYTADSVISGFSESDFNNITSSTNYTLNIHAYWAIGYLVEYDLKGGQWIGDSPKKNYTSEETLTLPVPPKMINRGYGFGGWFFNTYLTGNPASETMTFEEVKSHLSSGKLYLYAKWTNNNPEEQDDFIYGIEYVMNKGSWTGTAPIDYWMKGTTLPTFPSEGSISRERYTFRGWYRNNDYTGEPVTGFSESDFTNLTSDTKYILKLYAKWTTTYTIDFVVNEGIWVNEPAKTWDSNGNIYLLPTGFDICKPKSSFGGWYFTSNFASGSGPITELNIKNIEGHVTTVGGVETIKIYVKWINGTSGDNYTYEIKYETDFDEGTTTWINEPKGYWIMGTSIPTLPTTNDISNERALFQGWYFQSDFNGSPVTKLYTEDFSIHAKDGTLTLYAKWKRRYININYDLAGGTFDVVGENTVWDITKNCNLRTDVTGSGGSMFDGWVCDGNKVYDTLLASEFDTVYARLINNKSLTVSATYTSYGQGEETDGLTKRINIKLYHEGDRPGEYEFVKEKTIYAQRRKTTGQVLSSQYEYLIISETANFNNANNVAVVKDILDIPIQCSDNHVIRLKNISTKALRYALDENKLSTNEEKKLDASWDMIDKYDNVKDDFIEKFKSGFNSQDLHIRDGAKQEDAPEVPAGTTPDYTNFKALVKVVFRAGASNDSEVYKTILVPYGARLVEEDYPQGIYNEYNDKPDKWMTTKGNVYNDTFIEKDTILYPTFPTKAKIAVKYELGTDGGKFKDTSQQKVEEWDTGYDKDLPTQVEGPQGKMFAGWYVGDEKIANAKLLASQYKTKYEEFVKSGVLTLYAYYEDFESGDVDTTIRNINIKIYHTTSLGGKELVTTKTIFTKYATTSNQYGAAYKYLLIGGTEDELYRATTAGSIASILDMPIQCGNHTFYLKNINQNGLTYTIEGAAQGSTQYLSKSVNLSEMDDVVKRDFIEPFAGEQAKEEVIINVSDVVDVSDYNPLLPSGVTKPRSDYKALNKVSFKESHLVTINKKEIYVPYGEKLLTNDYPDNIFNANGFPPAYWEMNTLHEQFDDRRITYDMQLVASFPYRPTIKVQYDLVESGATFKDTTLEYSVNWNTATEDLTLPMEIEVSGGKIFDGWTYTVSGSAIKIASKQLLKDDFNTKYQSAVVNDTLTLKATYKDYGRGLVDSTTRTIKVMVYHKESTNTFTKVTEKNIFTKWSKLSPDPYELDHKYLLIGDSVEALNIATKVGSVDDILNMPFEYNGNMKAFSLKNINQKGLRFSLSASFSSEQFLPKDLDLTSLDDIVKDYFITPFVDENKKEVTIYVRDSIEKDDVPYGMTIPDGDYTKYRLFRKVSYVYTGAGGSKTKIKNDIYVVNGSVINESYNPTTQDENKITDPKTNMPMKILYYTEDSTNNIESVKYDYTKAITKDLELYPHRFYAYLKFVIYEESETEERRATWITNNWNTEITDNKLEKKDNAILDELIWYGNDLTFGTNTVKKNSFDFAGWETSIGNRISSLTYINYNVSDYDTATLTRTLYASYTPYGTVSFDRVVTNGLLNIHMFDANENPVKETGVNGELYIDVWKRKGGNEYFLTEHINSTSANITGLTAYSINELLQKDIAKEGEKSIYLKDINSEKLTYRRTLAGADVEVTKTEVFNSDNTKLKEIITEFVNDAENAKEVDIYVEAVRAKYYIKVSFFLEDYTSNGAFYREKVLYLAKNDTIDLTPNGDLKDIKHIESIEWYLDGVLYTRNSYTVTKNTEFYGYPKKYYIAYDPNGGKWIDTKDDKVKVEEIISNSIIQFHTGEEIDKGDSSMIAWSFSNNVNSKNLYIKKNNDEGEQSYDGESFIQLAKSLNKLDRYGEITVYAIWDEILDDSNENEEDKRNAERIVTEAILRVSLVDETTHEEVAAYGDMVVNVYNTNQGVGAYSYIREVNEGTISTNILKVEDYIHHKFKIDGGLEWTLANINNESLIYGMDRRNVNTYTASKGSFIATNTNDTKAIVEGLIRAGNQGRFTIYVSNKVKKNHDEGDSGGPIYTEDEPAFYTITWEASSDGRNYVGKSAVGNRSTITSESRKRIEDEVSAYFKTKRATGWTRQGASAPFNFSSTIITTNTTLKGTLGWLEIKYHANGGKWHDTEEDIKTIDMSTIQGGTVYFYTSNDVVNDDKVLTGWSFTSTSNKKISDTDGAIERCEVDRLISEAKKANVSIGEGINLYAIWGSIKDDTNEPEPDDWNADQVAKDVILRVSLVNEDTKKEIGVKGEITVNVYTSTENVGKYSYLRKVNENGTSGEMIKVENYLREAYTMEDGITKWSLSLINNKSLIYGTSVSSTSAYTVPKECYLATNAYGAKALVEGLSDLGKDNVFTIYVSTKVSKDHDEKGPSTPTPEKGVGLIHMITWEASDGDIDYEKIISIGNGCEIDTNTISAVESEISSLIDSKVVSGWRRTKPTRDTGRFVFSGTIIGEDTTLTAILDEIKLKYHPKGGVWRDSANVDSNNVKTENANIEGGVIRYSSTYDIEKGEYILSGWSFVDGGSAIEDTDGSIEKCNISNFMTKAKAGNYLKSGGIIDLYAIWEDLKDDTKSNNPTEYNAIRVSSDVTLRVSLVDDTNQKEIGAYGDLKVNVYTTKKSVATYSYIKIANDTERLNVEKYIKQSFSLGGDMEWSLSLLYNEGLIYGTVSTNVNKYTALKAEKISTNIESTKAIVEGLLKAGTNNTYTIYVSNRVVPIKHDPKGNNTPRPVDNKELFHEITWEAKGITRYTTTTAVGHECLISSEMKLNVEKEVGNNLRTKAVSGWKRTRPLQDGGEFDFSRVKITSDTTLSATVTDIILKYHPEGGVWVDGTTDVEENIKTKSINILDNGYIKYCSSKDITYGDHILVGWTFEIGKDVIQDRNNSVEKCEQNEFIDKAIQGEYIYNGKEINLYAVWEDIVDSSIESDPTLWNAELKASNVTLRVNLVDETTSKDTGIYGDIKVNVYTTKKGVEKYSYIRKVNAEYGLNVERYIAERYTTKDYTQWGLSNINNVSLIYGTSKTKLKEYTAKKEEYITTNIVGTSAIVEGLKNAKTDGIYTIYVSDMVQKSYDIGSESYIPTSAEGKRLFCTVTWTVSGKVTYATTSTVGRGCSVYAIERENLEAYIKSICDNNEVLGWRMISPTESIGAYDLSVNVIQEDSTFEAMFEKLVIKYHAEGGIWVDNTNVDENDSSIKKQNIGEEENITYYTQEDINYVDKILAGWSFTKNGYIIEDESSAIDGYNTSDFIDRARVDGYVTDGEEINLYAIWRDIKDDTNEDTVSEYNADRVASNVTLKVKLVNESMNKEIGAEGDIKVNVYTTKEGLGEYSYIKKVNETRAIDINKYIKEEFTTEDGTKWSLSNIDNEKLVYGISRTYVSEYNASKELHITTSSKETKKIIEGLISGGSNGEFTIYVSSIVKEKHDSGSVDGPKVEVGVGLFHIVTWKVKNDTEFIETTAVANGLTIKTTIRNKVEEAVIQKYKSKVPSSWQMIKPTIGPTEYDFQYSTIKVDTTLEATLGEISIRYHAEGGMWLDSTNVVNGAKIKSIAETENGYIKYCTSEDILFAGMILKGWSFGANGGLIKDENDYIDRYKAKDFVDKATDNGCVSSDGYINLYAIWEVIKDEQNEDIPASRTALKVADDAILRVCLVDETANDRVLDVYGDIKVDVYTTKEGLGIYSYVKKANEDEFLSVEDYMNEEYMLDEETEWLLTYINNQNLTYGINEGYTQEYVASKGEYITSNTDSTKEIVSGLIDVGSEGIFEIYVSSKVKESHDNGESEASPVSTVDKSLFHTITWEAGSNPKYTGTSVVANELIISESSRLKMEDEANASIKNGIISSWRKTKPKAEQRDFRFTSTYITEDTTLVANVTAIKIKYNANGGIWVDTTDTIKEQDANNITGNSINFYKASDIYNTDKILLGWSFQNGTNTIITNTDGSIDKCEKNSFISKAKEGNYITNGSEINLYAVWGNIIDISNEVDTSKHNAIRVADNVTLKVNLVSSTTNTAIGASGELKVDIYTTTKGVGAYSYIKKVGESTLINVNSYIHEIFNIDGIDWSLANIYSAGLRYGTYPSNTALYTASKESYMASNVAMTEAIVNGLLRVGDNNIYDIYVTDKVQKNYEEGGANRPVSEEDKPLFHTITWEVKNGTVKFASTSVAGNKMTISAISRRKIENGVYKVINNKVIMGWKKTKPTRETANFEFDKVVISGDITLEGTLQDLIIKYHPNGGIWIDGETAEGEVKIQNMSDTEGTFVKYYASDILVRSNMILAAWSFDKGMTIIEDNDGSVERCDKALFIEKAREGKYISANGEVNVYAVWELLKDNSNEKRPEYRNAEISTSNVILRVSLVDESTHKEIGITGDMPFDIYTTTKGVGLYSYIKNPNSTDRLSVEQYILHKYKTEDGIVWELANINNESLVYGTGVNNLREYTAPKDHYIMSNSLTTKTIIDGLVEAGPGKAYTIYVSTRVQDKFVKSGVGTPIAEKGKDLFHFVTWEVKGDINYATTSVAGHKMLISAMSKKNVENEINEKYITSAVVGWKKTKPTIETKEFDFINTRVENVITLEAMLSEIKIVYHTEGGEWLDTEGVEDGKKIKTIEDMQYEYITMYTDNEIAKGDAILAGWSFSKGGEIIENEYGYIYEYEQEEFMSMAREGNHITEKGEINVYAIWDMFIDASNEINRLRWNADTITEDVTLNIKLSHNGEDTGKGVSFTVNSYELIDSDDYRYIRVKNEQNVYEVVKVDYLLNKAFKISNKNYRLSYIDKDNLTYAQSPEYVGYNDNDIISASSYLNASFVDTEDLISMIANTEDGGEVTIYVDDKVSNPASLPSSRSASDPAKLPDKNDDENKRHIIDMVTWKKDDIGYEERTYTAYNEKIDTADKIYHENNIFTEESNKVVTRWSKTSPTTVDVYDFNTLVQEDITLEATSVTPKVKYDLCGGAWTVAVEGGVRIDEIDEGTDNAWSDTSLGLTKSGYSFYGWGLNTNANNNINRSITGRDLVKMCIEKSLVDSEGTIILKALWAKIDNGGNGGNGGSGGGGGGGGGGGSASGLKSPLTNQSPIVPTSQPIVEQQVVKSGKDIVYYYDTNQNKYLLIDVDGESVLKGIVDVEVEVDSTRADEIYNDASIGLRKRQNGVTTLGSAIDVAPVNTSPINVSPSQSASSMEEPLIAKDFVGPIKNDKRLDFIKSVENYVSLNNNLDKDTPYANVVSFADTQNTNTTSTSKTKVTLTYCLDDVTGYMYEGWKVFNDEWYYFLDAKKYGYMLKGVDYVIGNKMYSFADDGRCINTDILPVGWEYNTPTDTIQYKILGYLALDYDYKNGYLYAYDALTDRQGRKRYGNVLVNGVQLYFDGTKEGSCYVGPMNEFLLSANEMENKVKNENFAKQLSAKQVANIEAVIKDRQMKKQNNTTANNTTTNTSKTPNTPTTTTTTKETKTPTTTTTSKTPNTPTATTEKEPNTQTTTTTANNQKKNEVVMPFSTTKENKATTPQQAMPTPTRVPSYVGTKPYGTERTTPLLNTNPYMTNQPVIPNISPTSNQPVVPKLSNTANQPVIPMLR